MKNNQPLLDEEGVRAFLVGLFVGDNFNFDIEQCKKHIDLSKKIIESLKSINALVFKED